MTWKWRVTAWGKFCFHTYLLCRVAYICSSCHAQLQEEIKFGYLITAGQGKQPPPMCNSTLEQDYSWQVSFWALRESDFLQPLQQFGGPETIAGHLFLSGHVADGAHNKLSFTSCPSMQDKYKVYMRPPLNLDVHTSSCFTGLLSKWQVWMVVINCSFGLGFPIGFLMHVWASNKHTVKLGLFAFIVQLLFS